VEADDGDPAAGPEHLERGREPDLERLELVIDLDPQRLEDALRGMSLTEPCGAGIDARTTSTSWPVRSIGSCSRRLTMPRAICRA
jgi:hypothetical protein